MEYAQLRMLLKILFRSNKLLSYEEDFTMITPAYEAFNNPTYLKILEMEKAKPAPFGQNMLLIDGPATWAKYAYGKLGVWDRVKAYLEKPKLC